MFLFASIFFKLDEISSLFANITYKNYENICINCGTIYDYKYVNEVSFRDYNMNMSNMLFYKKAIYKRKKIYIKNVYILNKLMKI